MAWLEVEVGTGLPIADALHKPETRDFERRLAVRDGTGTPVDWACTRSETQYEYRGLSSTGAAATIVTLLAAGKKGIVDRENGDGSHTVSWTEITQDAWSEAD